MTNNNICKKQIGTYFKTCPNVSFCVSYVNAIQRIIKEKEFESKGG